MDVSGTELTFETGAALEIEAAPLQAFLEQISLVGDSDADTGEDKVEKEAKRIAKEKRGEEAMVTMADVLAVAQMYTDQYLEDEKTLNMLEPYARPKATETIPEMIAMIAELIASGHAYETEDGVYYAVTSFPAYGKLSGNTLENLSAGSRVSVDEKKKHPADFALYAYGGAAPDPSGRSGGLIDVFA